MAGTRTLQEWLEEEPFTLAMSSGFFGFYAHFGMLAALCEQGIKPAKVCGSSAGALVSATMGTRYDPGYWYDRFISLTKDDFWDPAPGFGLLKGAKFRNRLNALLPGSFEESELDTSVSGYDIFSRRTEVFTNRNLAHEDFLAAVCASCALPLLFQPVIVGGRYYLDGGIRDRHGLAGAAGESRVFYNHIASRSPWRRKDSPALQLPASVPGREVISLSVHGLPRSGPGKMHLAGEIIESSRKATSAALGMQLSDLGHNASGVEIHSVQGEQS